MAKTKGHKNKIISDRKESRGRKTKTVTNSKTLKSSFLNNAVARLKLFLSKLFTRGSKIVLLLILVMFLSFRLISFALPFSPFEKAKRDLLINPNNVSARLVIIDELLKNNQFVEAKRELSAVESIGISSSVLGTSSWLDELLTKYKESDPVEINKLINSWEIVVAQNPGYRDGFIKLSVYYYKLDNMVTAKKNLEKAKLIDPNFEAIKQLETIIN